MDTLLEKSASQNPKNLEDARLNPFCLDLVDVKSIQGRPRTIVTNEPFTSISPEVSVKCVMPPDAKTLKNFCSRIPLAGELLDWLLAIYVALGLVKEMRQSGTAGLITLGKKSGSLFCFLNSFKSMKGGPVLAYRALLPANTGKLQNWFIKRLLGGVTLIAVWSRPQIENYHKAFGIPRERFVFFPYKANHSKYASANMPVGDYIFSGGNSERDYKTLFEAVKGLPVPVIISATKPSVLRGLEIPENVICLNAVEPAFARLMAGARIVVLCLKKDIIRGTGEATMLNAMWHSKPVIIADNNSALDYIEDGKDGFITPAGDAAQVRNRILELWKDPAMAARVGEAGRNKVAGFYTHDQYKTRIQVLTLFTFADASRINASK